MASPVSRQYRHLVLMGPLNRIGQLDTDNDGQVKDRPDRRANRLGVMWINRSPRQDDAIGAKRVGAADDRSGISGIAHLSADDGETNSFVRQLTTRNLPTYREEPLTGDGIRKRIDILVSEHHDPNATTCSHLDMLSIASWVRGCQQIDFTRPC
jgi:hypothetical protein